VPCRRTARPFVGHGTTTCQRVQDVDRPAPVQALPQPPRRRGPRGQDQPLRIVPGSEDRDGIAEHFQRARHLGQKPAVRPAEAKLAVRLSIDGSYGDSYLGIAKLRRVAR